MTYRVEVTARASGDLRRIYNAIRAGDSRQAHAWFNGLEAAILSLDNYPARGGITREDERLRQLLYGRKPHIYRVIYAINESGLVVSVLHIRHGARQAFAPQKL
jgi:plasmid stabilization system protein ParE